MRLNRKNKLLLLGFLMCLIICYVFAISNTITYYKEYYSQKELLTDDDSNTKLVQQLQQKEKQLDLLLLKYDISTSEFFQNDLLKQLNSYSDIYNLKITDFKEPHILSEKEFVATSYIFSLEGSFNGCLALISEIENNPTLGSIKHLNFTKKRNYKNNVDQLFVEVILIKNKEI
jgi:hypothetical protein